MENQQPDLDSFEDFSGKFIKPEFVKDWNSPFIPINAESYFDEDEKARITYTGQFEGKKRCWEPNKTNMQIMKDLGIASPRALVGKKVFFRKVMNFSPVTKKKVPGLEIEKIE